MPAETASSFLHSAPNLHTLLQEANKLLALQTAWNDIAPRPLAAASTVGTLHGQAMIVYANNGAVAAKLRQLAPSLQAKFQERGIEVTAIRVDVQVAAPQLGSKPKSRTISRNALNNIEQLESGLSESPLKNALMTLIRHHSEAV